MHEGLEAFRIPVTGKKGHTGKTGLPHSSFLYALVPSAQAQEIRSFYDDAGRLSGVVDQQGNAARYVYDEVGNILEIRRTTVADFPGPVAITFFDPDRGHMWRTGS
ncbi:MAG: RHS repeat domain-containing protein [Dehalococcoidia bacterium]